MRGQRMAAIASELRVNGLTTVAKTVGHAVALGGVRWDMQFNFGGER